MSRASIVRNATPDDFQECWRLLLLAHAENSLFPLAPEKVEWLLNRILYPDQIPEFDTGPRGVIGVIGPAGALEGLSFILLGEFWYTRQKNLEEILVYVEPKYRNSNHARSFINWMKFQSEITGLPLITGVISNYKTEAKCRLYGRMIPKVGEFFAYFGEKGSNVPSLVMASS